MRISPIVFRIVVSLCFAVVLAGVCVLPLTAITVFAQEPKGEPPTPSKPDLPKDVSLGAVSLSVDHVQEGESTKLTIRWQGQPASSLLVVSVDVAHREEEMIQREGYAEVELTGVKALRRIADQGDISIVLSHDSVRELRGLGDWLVNVCITKEINFLIRIEDPSVKGGGRFVRKEMIDGASGPSELRFLTAAHWRKGPLEALFPSLKPFTVDVPENGFFVSLIEHQMLSAFLTFTVPVRNPPSER